MLICLKLSGGLITEKDAPFTARRDIIARLSREISESPHKFVIVHGGGSFGHVAAKKWFENRNEYGFCETLKAMIELNKIFIDIFSEKNAVFSICLSNSVILKKNRVHKFSDTCMRIIRELQELEIIPVTYGVPCLDTEQKFGILSGDEILVYLARELNADRVISGTVTEVLGENKKPIGRINSEHFGDMGSISGSSSTDVTGGMYRKVKELIELANDGIPSQIVDLRNKPLKDVINDPELGTVIT